MSSGLFGRSPRIAATACWDFPIYSQTFVYQELVQLVRKGFHLRFLYSQLNSRDHLAPQFSPLWSAKRKLVLDPGVYERDREYFERKYPARLKTLVEQVCRASGLTAAELEQHYHYRQAFSFARMVEAFRPDYLHSYFFYEGTLFTLFASHLLDIPRGVSCYADHLLDDYVMKVVPLHLEQCAIVVATSKRIKRELMAIAPHVPPDKILVKPNAIDSSRFPEISRRDQPLDGTWHVACVSRIEPKKGIVYLVEALHRLRRRNLPVELHLIGGADNTPASQAYAATVDERIASLGLAGAVHRHGRQPEPRIRELLEKADVFAAPFVETETGDKDGIPTALLEAMATGIPAVVTDAGSIPEVVTAGIDGLGVPQRDPDALADAIESLLRDPARRRALGARGAHTIRERFDVDVCEKLLHERVRQVVAERRRRR